MHRAPRGHGSLMTTLPVTPARVIAEVVMMVGVVVMTVVGVAAIVMAVIVRGRIVMRLGGAGVADQRAHRVVIADLAGSIMVGVERGAVAEHGEREAQVVDRQPI